MPICTCVTPWHGRDSNDGTRTPRETLLTVLFWSSHWGQKTSKRLVLVKTGSLNMFFFSFLFSMFYKTLVGSLKYISVCVGLRNKKSAWFILAVNRLCISTLYLLLNFHFSFLADYCRVTYLLILEEMLPDSWKVFPWFISGSLSTCTCISNIVSPWQSQIRQPVGISHHIFLHVPDLPGSRLWWKVIWWWFQRREHQSR